MQGSQFSFTANYDVADLVVKIGENKTKHYVDYTEAVSNYFSKLEEEIQRLEKHLADKSYVKHQVSLVVPIDNTVKYDELINCLKLSTDEQINLTMHDYDTLVNDKDD